MDSDLNGKSIHLIIEDKGKPLSDLQFLIKADSLFEYQYNLYDKFPNYKIENITIKELLWENGYIKTVVWFYKEDNDWISIDNLTWDTRRIDF